MPPFYKTHVIEKIDDSQSNDTNQLDMDPFGGDSNQATEPMEVDDETTLTSTTEKKKDKTESDDDLDILVEKVVTKDKSVTDKESSETAQEKSSKETDKAEDSDSALVIDMGEDQSKESEQTEKKESSAAAKKPAMIKVANLTGSNSFSDDVIDLDDDAPLNKTANDKDSAPQASKCKQCSKEKPCSLKVKLGTESFGVCSQECKTAYENANHKAVDIPSEGVNSKREKRCAFCLLIVEPKDERNLSWETMEFCNEDCLGKFQNKYGSYCRNCNGPVQPVSLGKYCVRFGYDVRQFCCSTCLEEFKKGLKVCSYCQKDISAGTEGFLAPVGDKGQFKDFCTQDCMEKYTKMNSTEPPAQEKKTCSVCQEEKLVYCEVQLDRNPEVAICSEPCFAAFKFVNKVDPENCSTCKKYFQNPTKKGFVVFYENEAHSFCNKTCLNVFIITNRKIVPCNWCKVKKYNFDMIRKDLKTGQIIMMCSLNCLTLYQVSINAVSARRINCDFCKEFSQAQYHLTMSDATIRNFCSYNCVMNFQAQYTRSPITIPTGDDPVPTGVPKRSVGSFAPKQIQATPTEALLPKKSIPVISSVTSLAPVNGQSPTSQTKGAQMQAQNIQPMQTTAGTQTVYKQQIITRPPTPPLIANKVTQCRPQMHTKGVSCRPIPNCKETQTDIVEKCILPVPVPIYVPFPCHMYSMPYPVPVPIPIPIPVPIFIPTTRNSAKGIFKEIKRIQEKLPSDPFEAELLMMAEMAEIATDKKVDKTASDSDSGDDNRELPAVGEPNNDTDAFDPTDAVDSSNTFGDDMLQMALKMATGEIEEPAVDLEAALTPSTIQAPPPSQAPPIENNIPERLPCQRGRKRGMSYPSRGRGGGTAPKRGRRSGINDVSNIMEPEPPQPRYMEPVEKPDANMALKYTFGVNAWRQWVITKNTELEKQANLGRKIKLFKTDLLQLTADELNYTLCLFVKEVRKPNGTEYAPDTIYYLCLGIQQYLFENNRIDNIFTDAYYEKFTDCLNDVAVKFSAIYTDAQFIVTRVEEEHLWECKQLGAHSPHVLLNTLMFFSTKHFNLTNVDEHMQLSFSHIMKHWKRSANNLPPAVGKPTGTKNVILRFYPPHNALDNNPRKKKVYEQQENEENPLRCPVKLYEFYLSKCPESVKTRNDVFYLLPERSCVPDSPVWYSTTPLGKDQLVKMINRIKMVKEINVALLQS